MKIKRLALVAATLCMALALALVPAHAGNTTQGKLADGTPYRIDMPEKWNGTVLIGLDYAAREPEADARALLARGYAMAGTTRAVSGWAIHQAAANAVQTLDLFEAKYGKPKHAIEFGRSQGGHTAAVSVQAYPRRWHGALVQCGGLSGSVGQWQSKFDALFVARELLAPNSSLPVIHIPQDWQASALPAWSAMLEAAEKTPAGRARIALAATLAQLPDWSDPAKARPAPSDTAGRAQGLADSLVRAQVRQAMSSRAQIEQLGGGNISSNEGVDYAQLLRETDSDGLVATLYREAGLDLQRDLATLAAAPRVKADPAALAYVATGVFDGELQVPVLTLSGIGDPISGVAGQQFYGSVVDAAGKGAMLRQTYTASAGHCGFTPAETVAAVQALTTRIDGGAWPATDAAAMSAAAGATDLGPSRFIAYAPARFVRRYDACQLTAALNSAGLAPVHVPGQALPVCAR